jgi:signal transduction histidine kinase
VPAEVVISITLALSALMVVVALRSTRRPDAARESADPGSHRTTSLDAVEVLDTLTVGVLLLTTSLTPVFANSAARRFLRLSDSEMPARLGSDELVSIARRALAHRELVETEMTLWPARTHVRVQAIPREEDVVVLLDDVSQEQRTHQIRRQFVVNASHELKTPVAGMQVLAEAIAHAIDDDPRTAKDFALRLMGESERLGRLIQDLLDLSRLEDPAHFSDQRVDLAEIVRAETARLEEPAGTGAVMLSTDATARTVIRGDGQQLALMVRNLIDNAIRYTAPGGRVDVRLESDETEVVLAVEDTGAGIPLQAQARVFERFFRVDQDRARDSGGTGLGLSIVKHVAESHGGHVELESELGEGSAFRVRLPVGEREDTQT